jgi:hypothetical protein
MTLFLTIAVVALAGALVYALTRRQEASEAPDLGPAIQAATSKAMEDLLRVNDEARKVDAKAAEAVLETRQTEIKALAERIAKGQE